MYRPFLFNNLGKKQGKMITKQTAGNHEQSFMKALRQNVRPVQEISEIKQELGKVSASAKRFVHAYEPVYGPVVRGIKGIPCNIAHLISGTICLPNRLLGKVIHPGGHFSTVKRIFSSVAGFPCHLSQHSTNAVCHPRTTFSKVMRKVQRGGKNGGPSGSEFDFIYHLQENRWYPIESTPGRAVLASYLAYMIETETEL